MFLGFNTKDKRNPKIEVHVDEFDGSKGVNDLEEWPFTVEIEELRVYLSFNEADRLAKMLEFALQHFTTKQLDKLK